MTLRKTFFSMLALLILSPLAYASSSDTCNGTTVECMGNVVNTTTNPAVYNISRSINPNGTLAYYLPGSQQTLHPGGGSNVFNFYSNSTTGSPNVGTVSMAYDLTASDYCTFTFTFSKTGSNQAYISDVQWECSNTSGGTSDSYVATCDPPTQRVVCYINPKSS